MSRIGLALVVLLLTVAEAVAQGTNQVELKGVVGTFGFLDEATDYYPVVGGAVRVPLSPALSLEPEVLYMRESALDDGYAFQAALIRKLRRGAAVGPYLVVGAGVLHRRFEFPGALDEHFSSNEFTGGAGGGLRVRLSDRLWLSPEARLGWEPIVRVTVSVGLTVP